MGVFQAVFFQILHLSWGKKLTLRASFCFRPAVLLKFQLPFEMCFLVAYVQITFLCENGGM